MKLKKRLEAKEPPHWFGHYSSRTIFWKTTLSVVPILIGLLCFDWRGTLGNLAGALMAGFGFELVFRTVFHTKSSLKDGDLFLICVVLTPLLPAEVNLRFILSTVFVSCVVARLCFGGRGGSLFFAVPIGLLTTGLIMHYEGSNSLLASHSNWFLSAAIALSALWALKSPMIDIQAGFVFFVISVLCFVCLGLPIRIADLNILIYSGLWILSDAPKPFGKKARLIFAVLCGIYTGMFHVRGELIQAALTSIVVLNLFSHELEEHFSILKHKPL